MEAVGCRDADALVALVDHRAERRAIQLRKARFGVREVAAPDDTHTRSLEGAEQLCKISEA